MEIKLSGRIDTTNVNEIENKIIEEVKDYKGEIILDAEELEYISSAGLRMILKLKKMNDKTKVINCSLEIYGIFEMTGFSDMMEISKSLRKISVEGCEKIGDGFYGAVYRINPETIVKVYKKPDCLDMVKREKELARKAFVLGIPTAIPYDTVKVGDSYGSVFELLNCKSLQKLIQEGEDVEKLAKDCVEILKKIHSTVLDTNELPNKKEQTLNIINDCNKYLPVDTYNKVVELIKNIPDSNTMIHGDFHIKNLMKQDDEIIIIDMDTISIGNPIFEFGAMYSTYVAFSCINHKNADEFLGITYDQSVKIWDVTFNTYYKDKSEEEKENLLKQIKILAYLKVLYMRTKYINKENIYQQQEVEYSKNYIIDNIDNVKS